MNTLRRHLHMGCGETLRSDMPVIWNVMGEMRSRSVKQKLPQRPTGGRTEKR